MSELPDEQRVLRYHAIQTTKIDTIPVRKTLQPDEVMLKIHCCGLCGSDLHTLSRGPRNNKSKDGFPLEKLDPATAGPHTMGHEVSGTVIELGSDVEKAAKEGRSALKVGSRVAAEAVYYCGDCPACNRGLRNYCMRGTVLGTGQGGGLATYSPIRATLCHPVPDNMTMEEAALVEPMAASWNAVAVVAKPVKGETALVLGAGPVGLGVVKVLAYLGIKTIIISEPSPARSTTATKCGASQVINPITSSPVEAVMKATDNLGVDMAFDCAGVQSGLDAAFESVRIGGRVVGVAVWEKNATFNPMHCVGRGVSFHGSLAYAPEVFPAVIKAISSGGLEVEDMISSKIPLEDAVYKGFKALQNEPDKHVKILVYPTLA